LRSGKEPGKTIENAQTRAQEKPDGHSFDRQPASREMMCDMQKKRVCDQCRIAQDKNWVGMLQKTAQRGQGACRD